MTGPPAAPDATQWCEGDHAEPTVWPDTSGNNRHWGSSVALTFPTILPGYRNGHTVAAFDGVNQQYFRPAIMGPPHPLSPWNLDVLFSHRALTFFFVIQVDTIAAPTFTPPADATCDIYYSHGLAFARAFEITVRPPNILRWSIATVNADTTCIDGVKGEVWVCDGPPRYFIGTTIDEGEWDILACWYDGHYQYMRTARNATVVQSAVDVGKLYAPGDLDCNGNPFSSNQLRPGSVSLGIVDEPLHCKIAELVTYNRLLTCEEFNGVLAYESAKYDIPCPIDPCGPGLMQGMYTTAIGVH